MDFVIMLHALLKYAVLLAGVIGFAKTLLLVFQRRQAVGIDQTLAVVFLGVYDLQALLGILVIFLGGLRGVVHPTVMFVGLLIAHWLSIQTRKAQGANANLIRLGLYAAPLLIVLFGLAIIGQLRF